MQWQQIREHYPQQWLLLEALKAHSEGSQRVIDQLAVLETYMDSASALQGYSRLHRETPERDLYVFHTSRGRERAEPRCADNGSTPLMARESAARS